MSNEKLFEDVQKEIAEAEKKQKEEEKQKEIVRIKAMMYDILSKIEEQKSKKEKAEEALRILKLDLEDLRSGKLEKIQERHRNERAQSLVPLDPFFQCFFSPDWITKIVSGTYEIQPVNTTTTESKVYYF